MKIVMANNYYYLRGGSERVMFDEIDGLRALGHEIFPFSRQHHANLIDSPFFVSHLELSDRMSVTQKLNAARRIIYSGETVRKLSALLKESEAEVVHGHNIYGGLSFSAVAAAKKRKVPFVLTLHDYKLICPSYLMLHDGHPCRQCLTKGYSCCTFNRCHKGSFSASLINTAEMYTARYSGLLGRIAAYICPSRFIRAAFLDAGFPERKLIYLPNALRLENFVPDYEHREYVLFAGRLSPEKGVKTLLKALATLELPVRIVGTGPLEAECRTLGETLPQVKFEGYCSGETLADLYRHAALLVVPSEWYENAPMSILEAFAYGKPVIGSRIGGIPELIEDGVDGALFTPGNYEELAAVLQTWWGNAGLLASAGAAARRKMEEKFHFSGHLSRLEELYRQVVTEAKP